MFTQLHRSSGIRRRRVMFLCRFYSSCSPIPWALVTQHSGTIYHFAYDSHPPDSAAPSDFHNLMQMMIRIDMHRNGTIQLCKVLCFQLRRISKIRSFLTGGVTNTLAVAFILPRLDYCNSRLACLPDHCFAKLQRIHH